MAIRTPYTGYNGQPVTLTSLTAPPTSPVPTMPSDYRAGEESPYEYWTRLYGQTEADRRLQLFTQYIENAAQGPGELFPGLPRNPQVNAPNLFDLPSLERAAANQPPRPEKPAMTPSGARPQPPAGGPQEQLWWTYPAGQPSRIVRAVVGPSGYAEYLRGMGESGR